MAIAEDGILMLADHSAFITFNSTEDLLAAYGLSEKKVQKLLGNTLEFLLKENMDMVRLINKVGTLQSPPSAPSHSAQSLQRESGNLSNSHNQNKKTSVNNDTKTEQRTKASSDTAAPKLDYYQLITGGGKGDQQKQEAIGADSQKVKENKVLSHYQGYLGNNPVINSQLQAGQLTNILEKQIKKTAQRPKFTEGPAKIPENDPNAVIVVYSDSDGEDSGKNKSEKKRDREMRGNNAKGSHGRQRSRSRSNSRERDDQNRKTQVSIARGTDVNKGGILGVGGYFVMVENLQPWTTFKSVNNIFPRCNPIQENSKLILKGKDATCAFLEFTNPNDAENACNQAKHFSGKYKVKAMRISKDTYEHKIKEIRKNNSGKDALVVIEEKKESQRQPNIPSTVAKSPGIFGSAPMPFGPPRPPIVPPMVVGRPPRPGVPSGPPRPGISQGPVGPGMPPRPVGPGMLHGPLGPGMPMGLVGPGMPMRPARPGVPQVLQGPRIPQGPLGPRGPPRPMVSMPDMTPVLAPRPPGLPSQQISRSDALTISSVRSLQPGFNPQFGPSGPGINKSTIGQPGPNVMPPNANQQNIGLPGRASFSAAPGNLLNPMVKMMKMTPVNMPARDFPGNDKQTSRPERDIEYEQDIFKSNNVEMDDRLDTPDTIQFIGFLTPDDRHCGAALNWIKQQVPKLRLLQDVYIDETPDDSEFGNEGFTVTVITDTRMKKALPKFAIVDGEPVYITHSAQDYCCEMCRAIPKHGPNEDCPAEDSGEEVVVYIAETSLLSPTYREIIYYDGISYPTILDAVENEMMKAIGSDAARSNGPKRNSWLHKNIHILMKLYDTRLKRSDRARDILLNKIEANKILFTSVDPMLGLGIKQMMRFPLFHCNKIKHRYFHGKNLIGKILMDLRDSLKSEEIKMIEAQEELKMKEERERKLRAAQEQQFAYGMGSTMGSMGTRKGSMDMHSSQGYSVYEPVQENKHDYNIGYLNDDDPGVPLARQNMDEVGGYVSEKYWCEPGAHKNAIGATEKVVINGFPDKVGQTVEDLYGIVLQWLLGKAPNAKIMRPPTIDRKPDAQGTVYNIITIEVKSYLCPALQMFNVINGVACVVKHPSQKDCCTVCRRHHMNTECSALLSHDEKVAYIDDKHGLSPFQENIFTFEGRSFRSYMEALRWLEEKDLGMLVVQKRVKHKLYTWEANNYQKLREMYRAQVEQCPRMRVLIQYGLSTSNVVYCSDELILGSGTFPGHDVRMYRPVYHPGLNFLGSIIKYLMDEFTARTQ